MKATREEMLSNPVWIWSARNMGPLVARMIINNGGFIKGFVDNSKDIQNTYIMNLLVYSPNDFYKKIKAEDKIICCCTEKNNKDIICQLEEHGITKNVREIDLFQFDGYQKKWGDFIENGYENRMISKICNQEDFKQKNFNRIRNELGWNSSRLHRKIWEYVFIINVLEENNMLIKGKKGLGFAIGEEPLTSYFASKGVKILATDLGIIDYEAKIWASTGQNAAGNIDKICKKDIVSREVFDQFVSYRDLDMNNIPEDIGLFDFCWSSCAIEHVGGLNLSKAFLKNMIKVLKPGGIAVHTTEFNLWSNEETEEDGYSIIYRKKDLEELKEWYQENGCTMELSFKRKAEGENMYLPIPPYEDNDNRSHINLVVGNFASTSYGIIVKK